MPDFERLAGWGLLTRAVTDSDGRFELRGVGQDRVALLRFEGEAIVTQDLEVVNHTTERFTVRSHYGQSRITGCP